MADPNGHEHGELTHVPFTPEAVHQWLMRRTRCEFHTGKVKRTTEEFRRSTGAALARCVASRDDQSLDATILDLTVLEDEAPADSPTRYRERPRFQS